MTVSVLCLRIKDRHAGWLSERAREANLVWNFCNELSLKVWQREHRFLSGFDFWPFLKGAGKWLSLWDSYGLGGFELRAGSISEDARGRWYLNVCVERPDFVGPKPVPAIDESVGIDLGLKDLAALSTGHKEAARQVYRDLEPALAVARRARKKCRVKAIYARIANRRRDHQHKFSNRLVREHRAIFVGNVNARALARTRMAKSVLDAGWSSLRTLLRYKCDRAGVWFEEVDEAFSTQTCSACGALPPQRPKGIAGLGMREWTCSGCATMHDRDVNAARNILAVGHVRLGAGIFHLQVGEDVNVAPVGLRGARPAVPGWCRSWAWFA